MTIAICDDEKIFRDHLTELVKQYSSKKTFSIEVSVFPCGDELLASKKKFDIIILDYMMDGFNGIETIKAIRSSRCSSRIIFASNYPDIVFESIKYNIFRFLVKPVKSEDLFEALDTVTKELLDVRRIVLKDHETDRNVSVLERDIIYAQADNVYAIVTTVTGIYVYKNSISTLQENLSAERFCRTNRSFLVNLEHIDCYTKSIIQLKNGHRAVISRRRFKIFQEQYFSFLKNNYAGT